MFPLGFVVRGVRILPVYSGLNVRDSLLCGEALKACVRDRVHVLGIALADVRIITLLGI